MGDYRPIKLPLTLGRRFCQLRASNQETRTSTRQGTDRTARSNRRHMCDPSRAAKMRPYGHGCARAFGQGLCPWPPFHWYLYIPPGVLHWKICSV